MQKMKKAFTLVEMLVVVGILGVLVAVLLGVTSGATESARAASCLSNMKSLASACQSYAMANNYYPNAGNFLTLSVNSDQGRSNVRIEYGQGRGWISWASRGQFQENGGRQQAKQACEPISMFTDNTDDAHHALTNGVLWKYVAANSKVYVCPSHTKKVNPVHWSYLMNAAFGWDAGSGETLYCDLAYGSPIKCFQSNLNDTRECPPDRVLLFAEVPFTGPGDWFPSGTEGSTDTDAILQFQGCNKAPTIGTDESPDGKENIGANHKSGKYWFAHVVYTDGHVDKIRASKADGTKMSSSDLKKLTEYLCTGVDFSIKGNNIEVLDQ